MLVEAALAFAAMAWLVPQFAPLASLDAGRDGRFAAASIGVGGLPSPVLPDLCVAYGADAEDLARERLCPRGSAAATVTRERAVARLTDAFASTRQAFLAPLREADARIGQWRAAERAGEGDVPVLDHAVEATTAEVQPYIDRYAIEPGTGPRPLACAFAALQGGAPTSALRSAADRATLRANTVLLLGAALDGHPATGVVGNAVSLPAAAAAPARCAGLETPEALGAAALLIADAREAPLGRAKNTAMRTLLVEAPWHWLGFVLLAFALLQLGRRSIPPAIGVALALAAWAAAAWIARVPWPLAGRHAFVLARPGDSWLSTPAPYVLVMLGAAAGLLALAPWSRQRTPAIPQAPGSVLAFPGLVLATGLGWLVLLDLSANGHFGNRYLALYHEGHLWLALATFGTVGFLRQPLGRGLAWLLAVAEGGATRLGARIGTLASVLLLVLAGFAVVLAVAGLLLNVRQLTSELGRLWLIAGAAWFFFLRGTPLTLRLARSGNSLLSLARYVWPLLFVAGVLVGAMIVTRDMGPLLIAGYGAGAFVAASIAMWLHHRTGAVAAAGVLAVTLFAGWIAVTTYALFQLGSVDQVTAARLENAAAPLASANDHLALVTWFQRAAPRGGFGPGAVPWCGFAAASACSGVPGQIQSDYTFTALVGTFGWIGAWIITLGVVLWLHDTVRAHARVTQGEPRLVRVAARITPDGQPLLSWVAVAWAVLALCQLAVTVAGNLAVIPLTGVTFPFVSFGMASLVMNAALLAIGATVDAPAWSARG